MTCSRLLSRLAVENTHTAFGRWGSHWLRTLWAAQAGGLSTGPGMSVATGGSLTHTLPTPAEGRRQTNSTNSDGFWDEWLH